jgi:hypothetical protein
MPKVADRQENNLKTTGELNKATEGIKERIIY